MTVLFPLPFSCFQAFSAAPARPAPLSRPSFVTNLLRQPVSDLFQFYAAFPLPSHLISFSVTFSLPSRLISFSVIFSPLSRLIPFFAAFSLPSRLISFSVTFSLPTALFHFCCILASVPPYSRLLFCYFQFIYNTFSVYFPVRSFCPYLLHTPRVFISSSNATSSVDSDKQKAPALR
mgnify:CR=1 FL=1